MLLKRGCVLGFQACGLCLGLGLAMALALGVVALLTNVTGSHLLPTVNSTLDLISRPIVNVVHYIMET